MPWLIVLLGYLLGSIPTAYIAGRLVKDRDIRQMGDANMGAANAFHQLGAKVGVAVFFIDAGKGALAILIAQVANIPQLAILATGVPQLWVTTGRFLSASGVGGVRALLLGCY